MRNLVRGIGINDSTYQVRTRNEGKDTWCPYYRSWVSMLSRACSIKTKERHQSCIGVTVCKEWHSFMAFREWMMQQDWDGKQLDKDLLVHGNKEYGPNYCIFVDQSTNKLLGDGRKPKNKHPIGVYWDLQHEKFRARCRINGKHKHLGLFLCAKDAHREWQLFKISSIKIAANNQYDKKISDALLRIASKIHADIKNESITEWL